MEFLSDSPEGLKVGERLARPGEIFNAPHLIDLEVMQVLRRLVRKGVMSEERASAALDVFLQLRLVRHRHVELLGRIWRLRNNLTAYDASYVALAELLDATLVTCDAKLGAAKMHRARIEVIGA